MAQATELVYTPNELEAIEVLRAHAGVPMSAKELGLKTVILTSLMTKAKKFADDPNVVVIEKSDYNAVCEYCGAKISHKLYCIR